MLSVAALQSLALLLPVADKQGCSFPPSQIFPAVSCHQLAFHAVSQAELVPCCLRQTAHVWLLTQICLPFHNRQQAFLDCQASRQSGAAVQQDKGGGWGAV